MATLQQFKLLAPLQCRTATPRSPSSPRISTSDSATPYCFHFAQKLTLKRLLRCRFFISRQNMIVDQSVRESMLSSNNLKDLFASSPPPLPVRGSMLSRNTLKDLFASSPPPQQPQPQRRESMIEKFDGVGGFGSLMGRVEEYPVRQQGRRFGVVGLRYRLFSARRSRLDAIPE